VIQANIFGPRGGTINVQCEPLTKKKQNSKAEGDETVKQKVMKSTT